MDLDERLVEGGLGLECWGDLSPPVVKIACDDEWVSLGYRAGDSFAEFLNLTGPIGLKKSKMSANDVKRLVVMGDFNERVKESSLFYRVRR
jgi:hypothetical protein